MRTIFTILVFMTIFSVNTFSKVWIVSPEGEYKFCSGVNNVVSDNDTIEISSGIYEDDKQVTWTKNNLLIRGVDNGMSWESNLLKKLTNKPVLRAGSIIANDNSNGKGIFVIKGNNTTVVKYEFQNANSINTINLSHLNLNSGIYFAVIYSGKNVKYQKILLLK